MNEVRIVRKLLDAAEAAQAGIRVIVTRDPTGLAGSSLRVVGPAAFVAELGAVA